MNPLPVQLVCWKAGRNFVPYWHVKQWSHGMMMTKCGIAVPTQAGVLKNYLSVTQRPQDICSVCWPAAPEAA